MKHTEREELARRARKAQDAFTRAAAALTEWPREPNALSLAVLEACIGLQHLVHVDHDEKAKDKVIAWIQAEQESRKARRPDQE